jgi:glycosyltransferase involved in cell wall biosynthesis
MTAPLVTVAVPSFNQGRFLHEALQSLFAQEAPLEVFVLDGGSTDNSREVIQAWAPRLAGWRSERDAGQGAAINEGIARGRAPFVAWLNSDDWLLPGGLAHLLRALQDQPQAPAAYGRVWNVKDPGGHRSPIHVEPFNERRLATRCIVSQPGTLVRRAAWEHVGGVDSSFHLAMDYDLWWRLYRQYGPLLFVDQEVAVNRDHEQTKTRTLRRRHYQEAMEVVRRHSGRRLPLRWWLAQPYSVWWRSLTG